MSRTMKLRIKQFLLDCLDYDTDCQCGRPKNRAAPATLIEQAFDFLGSIA
jgi:hypothetical protein